VNYLWFISSVFLAFLLQSSISVLEIFPNLTLLVVYYIGMRHGSTKGILTGVIIGAVEDSLSSAILGPNMLAKGMVGLFSASFISGSMLIWTPILGVIAAALLTFTDNAVAFLSVSLFYNLPTNPSSALFIAIMQSIMNAPAGIFIRPKYAD
jgi:rod shape-determining protein MreD